MSNLYSIVIKAKDGTVAAKAFDTEHTNIAIALREKSASVFTESLPEELAPYKHDRFELIKRVRDILNDNSIQVYIRPMMKVFINDDGNYVFQLADDYTTLDGDHPELAKRLAPVKVRNSSISGGKMNKNARLFGKK